MILNKTAFRSGTIENPRPAIFKAIKAVAASKRPVNQALVLIVFSSQRILPSIQFIIPYVDITLPVETFWLLDSPIC